MDKIDKIIDYSRALEIQSKFDGYRIIIEQQGDKISLFTEDSWRDRASVLPQVVKEIKDNIKIDFIADSEIVQWIDGKPIPREAMAWIIQTKTPMSDDIVLHVNVHDCLFYDEEAINLKPYYERLAFLDKLLPKGLKYLKKAKSCVATDRKSFDKCLKQAYDYEGSEGSMVKRADSIYDISKPRTVDWCVGGYAPILTRDGFKPAWTITLEDYVISKDGKFHKVVRVLKRKKEDNENIFKVKPNHGLGFFISGNHDILIGNNKWQPIQEIPIQAYVPPFDIDCPMYPKSVDLDIMGYTKSIEMSPDFLKFLGFWVGDGANNQKKGDVTLSQKDVSVLKKYKYIIDSHLNVNSAIYEYIVRVSLLYFLDKPFSTWLSVNFRHNYKDKTIPLWVGSLPEDLFQHFLDGLIESDGYNTDRLAYSTSSAFLAGRLFVILRSRGFDISLRKYKPKKGKMSYRLTFLKNKLLNYELFDDIGVARASLDIQEVSPSESHGLSLYDFEIEGEDSYRVPYMVLHNSKIKKVHKILAEIIGLQRKALPFSSIGMKTPTSNIEGKEALSTYKKLTSESRTFIARCALRDNNKLVPLDSKKRLTDSDFVVKWNATLSKPKWQGLDSKDLWKMNKEIEDRQSGEQAFGNTYAFSFKGKEPKLGDIISVVPVQLVEFTRDDTKYIAWMFPKVISPEPEKQKADDIKDIQPMIRKE